MKLKIFFWLLLSLYILNCTFYIQAQTADTTKTHINYRRTDTNNLPPTPYTQLPKEQVFPLGWNRGTFGKVTSGTGVWTELNPKVPRVDYLGIHFVNKDTGWAVGDLGTLIKTIDGGSSWTVSQTNTATPILKVRSYNGQVVIASGFDGLILRSTDGGETFEQVTSNVTGDLWGLQMLNDTLGFACGNANSLTKTTDGGQTWQRIFTPGYTSDYWWIDFLTMSYGFIAANGKVLKTTDGGENWEIIQAGDSQPLFTIDVIDSLHIATAGYGGTGYGGKNIYSSDGGNTWINGGQTTTHEINCIKYIDTDTGYIVMSEIGIYKTTNKGQNWQFIPGIEGVGEYELALLPEMIGYSAGTNLKIYKTENGYDYWKRLIINDNFSDVFFVNEQKGFAISSYGLSNSSGLYKTENGGVNWERIAGAPDGVDLLFLDSLTGFIGGSNAIYKTTDGGENWYATQGTTGAGKIFFIDSTVGWAVHSRSIYKTTDTGENWIEQITLPADSYTSIFFVDSLNGWATSRYIWQTTDGGVNWVERTDIPAFFSNDVYFFNDLKGWALAGNDLYYTTDGGNIWIDDPQIFTYTTNFELISNTHYIITGTNIYESVDTGKVWQNITNQVGSYFTSLHAPKEYLAYAVGPSGYILRYLDTLIIPVEIEFFTAENLFNRVLLKWITASEKNNYGFEILRSNDLVNWVEIGFLAGNGTSTERREYSFIDEQITSEKSYYKLKQIDYNGNVSYSEILIVKLLINDFFLTQNYPNPANPITTITYMLPEKNFVKINLYSLTGELIKEIINDEKEKGIYTEVIDLSEYSSGMYFYRMTTNSGYTATKKLIILK